MATKADFTEDEWEALRKGVTGAGMLVSIGDRDFTDTFGEVGALAKRLSEERKEGGSELMRELAAGRPSGFGLTASPEEVERAVRAVANGEVILGPTVAARAVAALTAGRTSARVPFPELTDREREVLDLVARGYDNLTISRRLVLSPKTVRNNVSTVLTKLGVPDRSAAIVRAREGGLGVD